MRKLLFVVISCLSLGSVKSQDKSNDFGRITLNLFLPNKMNIPDEAKRLLETKLNQVCTNNGMGGNSYNPRFIITANVNVGTKDIIPGPPQLIAQNIDITMFIGDAIENKIFSSVTFSLKGVGTNENKSFIDAFKSLNPKSKQIPPFIEEAKTKIISYYNSKCSIILEEAQTLSNQGKFDEAIYNLSLVPNVAQNCYSESLKLTEVIYTKKINVEANNLLAEAKAIWEVNPNQEGANEALSKILAINSNTQAYKEAQPLLKEISTKLDSDEKEQLKRIKEKEEKDREFELKKLDAYKEVAIEFAKKQPKTEIYNNIIWR